MVSCRNRVSDRDDSVLDYLAVHPDQQNKGVGAALISHGNQKAQQLGINIFVLAFSSGFKLYEKMGFKLLDYIIQDATSFGGNENYAIQFMEYKVTTLLSV